MYRQRAPTEADARRLDNEGPATTYLLAAVLPRAVTGSPRGTREVPRCASGASPCAQSFIGAFFRPKRESKKGPRPGRIVTLRQKTRLLADSRRERGGADGAAEEMTCSCCGALRPLQEQDRTACASALNDVTWKIERPGPWFSKYAVDFCSDWLGTDSRSRCLFRTAWPSAG